MDHLSVSDLISVSIIEKDSNNDVLWTWTYPTISSKLQELIIGKCGFENGAIHEHSLSFYYCHHEQYWFYLRLTDVQELARLPKVKQFILVLQTRDFNPEKYESLSQLLSKAYSSVGNPIKVLQVYLSVFLKGMCSVEENGIFSIKQFDKIAAYSCVPAKDIVKTFGLESILIYTALLLKKRIIVYHHRLDTLLWFVRALPAFMWHRQDWSIIYPYMELTSDEVSELLSLPNYIAGFREAAVEGRSDLYDLFVNLPAIEITIAHTAHAKEIFTMTKTHKEIAVYMAAQAENHHLNEKLFIKEISKKTAELLKNLRTLSFTNECGQEVIQLSILQEKKCAPALRTFLCNLATAEGFVIA